MKPEGATADSPAAKPKRPEEKNMHLLGVYNYTVVLTYIGMLISFAGIHFVFSNTDRSFILALLCLMIAGVMDMFDGKVASTKKDRTHEEKLFGIQIDSMADIISYGVFPAVLVYKLAIGDIQYPVEHPMQARCVICICAFYLLCALIRLSYFNVDEMERQEKTADSRHEYRGLPVTSVALVLPAVFIASYFLGDARPPIQPCAILLMLMGIMFISPFKMPKPAMIGKIIMIIVGVVELSMLILGKAYRVPTTEADPSVMFENRAPIDKSDSDSVNLKDLIPKKAASSSTMDRLKK